MKSIRDDQKYTPLKFPRLMISTISGDIYFMESEIYGVCINKHDDTKPLTGVAKVKGNLVMQDWRGKITLSNY